MSTIVRQKEAKPMFFLRTELRSMTKIGSSVRAKTTFGVAEGLVLAVLDCHDFALALSAIEGFDRWLSFDDYVCERDGLFIGMCCAGREAQLVSISMRSFERWMLHSGVSATIQALDEFAARIHAFRLYPGLSVEGMPLGDWNRSSQHIWPQGDRFAIPISQALYEDWLAALSRLKLFTKPPSVDIYAGILMESWADSS
jgi:hypothetical protein